jgi:hypothetical protein
MKKKDDNNETRHLLNQFFQFFMDVQNELIDHTFTESWLRDRVIKMRETLNKGGEQ